LFNNNTCNVMC